ncbi:MAG: transposase [Planctomycetota bacterium]
MVLVDAYISKSFGLRAYWNGVKLDFSRPGKPTDNAFIESFNGKSRVECLNEPWFMSLNEVQRVFDLWRDDYNRHRPYCFFGNRSPPEFAISSAGARPG